eukprot:scaffold135886_cov33-Tisochrysis_lutea.AAC.3
MLQPDSARAILIFMSTPGTFLWQLSNRWVPGLGMMSICQRRHSRGVRAQSFGDEYSPCNKQTYKLFRTSSDAGGSTGPLGSLASLRQ